MARVESGGRYPGVPPAGVGACWGGSSVTSGGLKEGPGTGVVLECPAASASHLRAGSSSSTVCEEVPHLDPLESLFYHQLVSVPFSLSILNIKSCPWWGILGPL